MNPRHRVMAAALVVALAAFGCNGPPTGGGIRIEPSDPFSSDDLVMVLVEEFVDPNGDPLEVRAAWTRDGDLVEDLPDPFVVPAAFTRNGEVWAVQVSATDGKQLGPIHADQVSVRNAPPSADSIRLSPTQPTVLDPITASISTSDADGDEVISVIRWEVNGAEVPVEGDTLPAGRAERGQSVTAILSVSDGALSGTELRSESVTLVNSRPSITGANVQPSVDLHFDSTLECFAEGWEDADNDAPNYEWQWLVNGAPVGTSQELEGSFVAGDRVACQVTPTDGMDRGEPATSAEVTIEPGSIYDCAPADPMPPEPYRNAPLVPDRIQVEGTVAFDRSSGEFRDWCAGDGTRRLAIDLLVIGDAYDTSGSVRDVCALSLVPRTDTVPGERIDFEFDFRQGQGSSAYAHYGMRLPAGSFTVEDRRFETGSGEIIGGCLARRFSSPWPSDIRTVITGKEWTVGIGELSDEVIDSLRDGSDGTPGDPYSLYEDGYVFGVSSGVETTVGIGPLGYGQAYAVDTLTWSLATDADGDLERLSSAVAVPTRGGRLATGVYALASSYVWFAEGLLEP